MTTTPTTGFEILLIKPIQAVTQKTYNSENYMYGKDGYCTIYSVQRASDGEVFIIGDRVSNDLMKGKITEFHITQGYMYVQTTWSKVGICIDDIHKLPTLPSKYQEGDPVRVNFHGTCLEHGWVHKVHFTKNKVTYDVEILQQVSGKSYNFRLYNVDSDFVEDRTDKNL